MEQFITVTEALMKGFGETMNIFLLTLVFSIPLGLLVCFGTMTRFSPVRYVMKCIVWVIRGTPLMLQLIVVFYGPGLLFGLPAMGRFTAVLLAFSVNYACYFSEIYRGGIESIPTGQSEAGQALGFSRSQIFIHILLPQVVKRIVPSMGNEIITLVKDTSLARVIAVYEVMWMGQSFIKSDGLIWPMFYTGAFYLLFSGLLTLAFQRAEEKMNYYKD